MPGEYTITATSKDSAVVEDIVLPPTDSNAGKSTRKVLRAEIVANKWDRSKSVIANILHQRKSPKTERWEDVRPFSLAKVRAGEEVRLHLDASQTAHLYKALHDLYAVGPEHIPYGEKRLRVIDADGTQALGGHGARGRELL